jgi:hypothetical protein
MSHWTTLEVRHGYCFSRVRIVQAGASCPPLLEHIGDSREFRKSHYSDGILLFRQEEVRMREDR